MATSTTVQSPRSGSLSNVIAALASFFIAGLGQLLQGRVAWALLWFGLAVAAWLIGLLTFGLLGFVGGFIHILSCIHAALYRGP